MNLLRFLVNCQLGFRSFLSFQRNQRVLLGSAAAQTITDLPPVGAVNLLALSFLPPRNEALVAPIIDPFFCELGSGSGFHVYGKKRKIRQALEEEKPFPTELRNEELARQQEIDLGDDNTTGSFNIYIYIMERN